MEYTVTTCKVVILSSSACSLIPRIVPYAMLFVIKNQSGYIGTLLLILTQYNSTSYKNTVTMALLGQCRLQIL